ncbi:hypothetical protein ACOMHN_040631 [Nucella lapillus]
MAENYKEFDKAPIVDTSDVVIRGFRFRLRELALGIAVIVCLLVIIILAALLGSANSANSANRDSAANQCFSPPCLKTATHVLELVNKSAAEPCDDFHTFVCANFPSRHPLVPFEVPSTTFQLMHDKNQDRIRRILEQTQDSRKASPSNYETKMRTFFTTCRDHFTKMQQQGKPFLQHMVNGSGGWWALFGDSAWEGSVSKDYSFQDQLQKVHVDFWTDAFFTFRIITDWLDWNKKAIQINLSGLGLHLDYYYNPRLQSALNDYKTYMRKVGGLLLRDSGLEVSQHERNYRLDTFVDDALFVETEMAKLKRESNATENPHAQENRMKLSELNAASSNALDWVALFKYMFDKVPITGDTYVVILEKQYLAKFTKWISDLPAQNKSRILNNYLIWRMADHYDQELSWDYIHANRQVYVDLNGRAEFLGTWRYCVLRVDRDMKEAVGALFVRNHFSAQNKKTAHVITDYVRKALVDSLQKSNWMSDSTKRDAVQKISQSLMRLGYPDYMMDDNKLDSIYAQLKIGPSYIQNLLSFNAFFRAESNRLLTMPNDHTHWPYATYDFVAHYYSPWKSLYIPAGMLQFPIYDHSSPSYINYGSMGTIVGRMLTHAVDEYGNYYKLNGSGRGSWWSNATSQRYRQVRQCIMDAWKNVTLGPYLYSQRNYKVPVDASYYAPLALGESSSVKLAYKAYQTWIDTTGGEKMMPGGMFTNKQMFFVSYAQTYCRTIDPGRELLRVNQGRNPPEKLRVNSALSHVPEFQEAFQCAANSKMVAPKRCSFF